MHVSINRNPTERELILRFTDGYPKYESHYSRKKTKRLYLPSHPNVQKMYDHYCKSHLESKPPSYQFFQLVFNSTGYKFKHPFVDTCSKCDTFKIQIKQCSNANKKIQLEKERDDHQNEADAVYESKAVDKLLSLQSPSHRVLVFDLQQVLDTPALTSNVSFYN